MLTLVYNINMLGDNETTRQGDKETRRQGNKETRVLRLFLSKSH